MKLPVDMMRASLRAAVSLVRSGSDSEAAIALIEQVSEALAPTAEAIRKRRQRAKPVTDKSVTCHATSHAEVTDKPVTDPSRALPSGSLSSSVSVSSADLQNKDLESEKRAHASKAGHGFVPRQVTPDVTPLLPHQEVASEMDGSAGASFPPAQLERLRSIMPAIEGEAYRRGMSAAAMIGAAYKRFRNDPGVRAKRLARVDVFLGQWTNWLDDAPQRGIAPVSSVEEFEREARERAAREQHA